MSNLTPISRDSLRGLKAKKDEEERNQNLNHIINQIYNSVIHIAETTTNTTYSYDMRYGYGHGHHKNFPSPPEIINRLEALFPGCAIKHGVFIVGKDGAMHDVSTIDAALLPLITSRGSQQRECIVVNWQ